MLVPKQYLKYILHAWYSSFTDYHPKTMWGVCEYGKQINVAVSIVCDLQEWSLRLTAEYMLSIL